MIVFIIGIGGLVVGFLLGLVIAWNDPCPICRWPSDEYFKQLTSEED